MRRFVSLLLAAGAAAGVIAVWIYCSNRTFVETFYSLESDKIETPIRAILLSDLHQTSFGRENRELLARVEELHPDVILLAGDVVNRENPDWEYARSLCRGLAEIAPTCYGLGNHENEAVYGFDLTSEILDGMRDRLGENPEELSPLELDPQALQGIRDTGVILLQNESARLELKGNPVIVGGVSTNRSSFWPYSGQFITDFTYQYPEAFRLLICHCPDPVIEYIPDYPLDLAVSGHTHGGIIRIPGKGGLFSTNLGLFPRYDAGQFSMEDTMTLIISRGLGNHGAIPRVFNPPELVVIDIN